MSSASRISQSLLRRTANRSTLATRAGRRHYTGTSLASMPMKAGTKMENLAIFKGQDPPVVKEREEYPEWVGKLAEPLPSLAKLRKIPNEEADEKEILRFLKLNRRIGIRDNNEESSI
eukprot:CAMPEP_0113643668 /NCGR_PEP_ID=MMETSP0017_2-20120614/22971_1 /TAXON_ID=2856 /ORGANISM="Cylindrotheca closterium" /LENGTH=117 /DNA_ID=CAMNT_0000555215 /DNA_START=46 /DNA_END=402 /DNA_ORIENTATION=- /assembly_acc=CAM_ASM_000147